MGSADSAALYLAKVMVADHRYRPLDFPEAAPLEEVSDIVLERSDGVHLAIACIIDRDADPAKRFSLPPQRVDEIAAACRKYAGAAYGGKEVAVEIWEIGLGLPDSADRGRYEGYAFRRPTQKGVSIRAYCVDTSPSLGTLGALWSTAADASERREWVRTALHAPRRSDNELAHAAQAQEKITRFNTRPVATYALLASFVAVYVAELVWTVAPADGLTPNIGTLVALGALDHGATEGGEWWRMLTCAFLHGGLWHLLSNGIAMFMVGGLLEKLIGRRWLLGLFVIGALGGSVASLTVNADHIASVGASGAIMALFAAAMVTCLRLPKGPTRTHLLISLGWVLVPSLLPLANAGKNIGQVDFAAHLGGAIAGALGGLGLLVTWPKDAEHPRAGMFAAVVAAAGLAYTAYGWSQLAAHHEKFKEQFAGQAALAANPKLRDALCPDSRMPQSDAAIRDEVPGLLNDFPRDPRLRMYAAHLAFEDGDFSKARSNIEVALQDDEIMSLLVQRADFEARLRAVLAETYEREGNMDAARDAAKPSCKTGLASDDTEVRAYYQQLCAAP